MRANRSAALGSVSSIRWKENAYVRRIAFDAPVETEDSRLYPLVVVISARCASALNKAGEYQKAIHIIPNTLSLYTVASLISGKIMELLTQQLLWFRLRMKKQFEDGWLIYRVLLHETGNLLDGQR